MARLKNITFDPPRMEHRVVDDAHCYLWPEIGLRIANADPAIAKEKAEQIARLLADVSIEVVVEVVA